MLKLLVIYNLVMLLLLGVAIFRHVTATNLSLPISPGLTASTIAFLVFAVVNAVVSARLVAVARPHKMLGQGLRVAQAIITIVLATLFFSYIPASDARDCLLSTVWQRLFSRHDGESIRRIQDAYNCCGFNTVRDRAWPFPSHQTARTCEEMYGRSLACNRPLRTAMGQAAGVEFGIVLMSALVQIAYLLLEEYHSPSPSAAAPSRIAYRDAARTPLLPRACDDTENISENDADEGHANNRGETGDHENSPWR